MREKVCVVCLNAFTASAPAVMVYALDGRINDSSPLSDPDHPSTYPVDLGLCPVHEEYFKEGLVAVIEIETVKTQEEYNAMAAQAEGRTGDILYLPKEAILKLADFPPNNAVVFCEREPFERIKEASKRVWS